VGAGAALQQQAVLAGRTFDVTRVFLKVDLIHVLDVADSNGRRVFDIKMSRLSGLRLP
jgi:hypothetical protein